MSEVTKRVEKCDGCPKKLLLVCYDTKTKLNGMWANLCPTCYNLYGIGKLGTGLGQRYERKAVGTPFTKTAG
jgi:hypothetical protein